MKKLLKRSKGKKIIACVLAFSVALSALTISFVHADDEFYSGSLNEDVSRGSVIATFEFGTYPQRVVYDEFLDLPPTEEYIIIDETLYNNLVSATDAGNFDEGKFYTYEGVTYLREDGSVYDESQMEFVPKKLFYEMAPIEWQVLKIGKHSDGSDKVVAMTTRALECRPYNNSYNCNYLWDGGYYYDDDDDYKGDNLLDANKVNHQYPFLRMYLNSYDIYDKFGNPINFAATNEDYFRTYSTLSETELTDEEFYNKGFYEKAFSPSEKEAILLDTNELNIEELDGEVCYDKVRLLSAFEWFDEYSEDYLDEPYPVGIGSKFGFSPLQTASGVTSNRLSLVTGYAGWCYYGNNVEYVTDVWTKSCGPEHFTVTGSGIIYEGISQDDETGIRPVISIKADYFETNGIKLDIKATPYSHSEFAGWKVNGTHDDSLTGEVIENVDIFDVHKYMGEFAPEKGYTTINETTYSLYHQNDNKGLNHGYITYGSFPQSEITSTSDASLFTELESRLTSDGMTIAYEGNKYLREDKDGTPHYFLFEPIKWQILNYDTDEKKLILLSESCIDTSTWNTKSGRGDPSTVYDDETIMWNGEIVQGDPPFHVEGEKVSYPSLRLYLNSYDTTLDSYTFDGTDKYSLSSLTVTDYSDRPFKEQGFLTKAFTSDEINHLIEESNENYVDWCDFLYEDSLLGEPYEISKDKVRLLSCCEVMDWGEDPESGMILDMYARYGFSSTDTITGPESNRLGYTTNYSEFHFKPNEEAVTYDREHLLSSEYGGRKTIPWWTMSVYEDGHYYGSYLNGSDGSACHYEDTASVFAGIRPLISLDISNLTAMSGDGTINNPYTLGDTCLLRLSSEDTAKGTVSSAGTTQNGSFLEGRFTIHNSCTVVATPKEGYKFDGWYKGQTKVSDNEAYTFTLDGNTTLLAKFEIDTSGGGGGTSGGGSGGGSGGAASPKKEPEKKVITFKAFMNGYEDKTFKPGDFVTREEVAVIASRTNADFDELTNYTDDNKYIDTLDRWSKNYLGFTYKKKLLQGYEDGSFHPADKMTRGELATLALNILDQLKEQDKEKGKEEQEEVKSKIVFSDIEGKWYEENVKKLSKEGILNGYEDGTFRGDNYVTRIEVAIVFNKLTERSKDLIKDEDLNRVEELFKDTKKTDWFFSDLVLATIDHEKEEIKEEVKAK